MEEVSLGGARFYVLFQDDYSKKTFVYLIKAKSKVFDKFKIFKNMVKNQTQKRIKIFRSDQGTEFCNNNFRKLFEENCIIYQTSAPYCPEQNGKSERQNRTIVERARCLLYGAGLEKCYWGEAVNMAAYLINRTPCANLNNKSPDEVWFFGQT